MKALTRKQGNGRESAVETMQSGLAHFRDEIDRAMERVWRGSLFPMPFSLFSEPFLSPQWKSWGAWPAIDVSEDETGVSIRADIPGMEAKDVAVEVSGNELTIRGSREEEKEETTANVTRHERRFGKFERVIMLPPHIDADKLEAKYDKGTLRVTAPRRRGEGPKRVEVKASSK